MPELSRGECGFGERVRCGVCYPGDLIGNRYVQRIAYGVYPMRWVGDGVLAWLVID